MKKLLLLLFSILISFNSYGKTLCIEVFWFLNDVYIDMDVYIDNYQTRNGLYYLPNQPKPFSGKNLCIYENTQNHSKGDIYKGMKNGKWTVWHANGQKGLEGNYKDGNREGKWTSWHKNGQVWKEENYKNGKLVGETEYIVYLYSNSSIKESEGYLKDGKRDGKWTSWHKNGQIHYKGNYKDGEFDGKWTWWDEYSQKRLEENYKDGKLDGKQTYWYENGQIRYEGNYKDGKLDGKVTYWYENGQLNKDRNYKDGVCISGDC